MNVWAASNRLLALIRTRGGVRDLTIGSGAGVAISLSNRIVTIGTGIMLARMLGNEGYGIYAFAIASLGILGIAAELGLVTFSMREIARAYSVSQIGFLHRLRDGTAKLSGISSVSIFVIGQAVIWLVPLNLRVEQQYTLSAMLVVLVANTRIRIIAASLYGLKRIISAQLLEQLIQPALLFLLTLLVWLLVAYGFGPAQAMLMQIGAACLALVVGMTLLRKSLPPRPETMNEPAIKMLMMARSGLPFLLINAALILNVQVDTLIVGVFIGPAETGIYRVASQGAVLAQFAILILQTTAAPYFAALHQKGARDSLRRLYHIVTVLGLVFAIVITVIFATAGQWLIDATFGPQFVAAAPIMFVLALGCVGNAACGPVGTLLSMSGHEKITSRALWFTAAINLVGSIIAVMYFGSLGIAAVTAFTNTLFHVILRYFARTRLQI